jgi:hypothetical protein
MTTTTLVTGLVKVGLESDAALERIMALGHRRDEISVIMSDHTRKQHFDIEPGAQTAATTGAGLGIAVGSAVGAILAATLLVGASFVLPGIGLVVAGPLAAALVGVGAGGATGGAFGTLIGAGIPEAHARVYETALATGLIVIGVHARSETDVEALEQIFREVGAAQVQVVTSAAAAPARAA